MNKLHQRHSSMHVWVFILLLVVSLLYGTAAPITAQQLAPTPTVTASLTLTPIPPDFTPSATPTPTITPTSIPTLDVPSIGGQARITTDNAELIGKLRSWQAFGRAGLNGIVFSPASDQIIAVGFGSISESDPHGKTPIRVWRIVGRSIQPVTNHFQDVPSDLNLMTGLNLSSDGSRVTAFGSGMGMVWDTQSGLLMSRIYQGGVYIGQVEDFKTWIAGSQFGLISMWEIPHGINSYVDPEAVFDPIAILIGGFEVDEPLNQVAIDSSTYQIYALTDSGRLHVIIPSFYSGATYFEVPQNGQSGSAYPLAYSEYNGGPRLTQGVVGNLVAFTGSHRDVVLYDPAAQETVASLPLNTIASCVLTSPDGKLLVVAEVDYNSILRVIDATTFEDVARIETGDIVDSCSFSPDGTLIATGNDDSEVVLWGVP